MSGFMRRVGITDLLVISWAVVGAQLIRFGAHVAQPKLPTVAEASPDLTYTAFSVLMILAWLLLLRMHGAYDRRLLGHGPEEYKAVAVASLRLFTVVAIVSYVFRLEVARGVRGCFETKN